MSETAAKERAPGGAFSRYFVPTLAGATLRERALACLGALISISLTSVITALLLGFGPQLTLLVAPIGASAVLLFAVPSSPLAQPWPILGGNMLSALTGVLVSNVIPDPAVASGVAVALAIAVMSLTRSLHPPGGAAALTAVLGGPAAAKWGLLYPLVPVGLNACILLALGLAFHRLAGRSYPHRAAAPQNVQGTADLPAVVRVGFRDEDIDAALAKLDETFDIERADLGVILREVELQTIIRSHGDLSCADIMSRDVVVIDDEATCDEARALLLRHNIRVLPVVDRHRGLCGTVGLRELFLPGQIVAEVAAEAHTVSPQSPAAALLPVLTDGRAHAAVVATDDRKILGLITQTDLLAAFGRLTMTPRPPASGGDVRGREPRGLCQPSHG